MRNKLPPPGTSTDIFGNEINEDDSSGLKVALLAVLFSAAFLSVVIFVMLNRETVQEKAQRQLPSGCVLGSPVSYDQDQGVKYEIICDPHAGHEGH